MLDTGKRAMVGKEEVRDFCDPNNLEESGGAFASLSAKANFQRVPHFFDNPIHIRSALIAKRLEVGADTPYGHACSNIIEQLDGMFRYERPAWATDARQTLPWLINQQIARLEQLSQ